MNNSTIHSVLHIFFHNIQRILCCIPTMDHKWELLFTGDVHLLAEYFLLKKVLFPLLMPVIVQADLADQIDFAEPGDDLFDSPCFRLPGMNPCERGLQSLAGGTVRVDIDYAAFHNADRSEKTKL